MTALKKRVLRKVLGVLGLLVLLLSVSAPLAGLRSDWLLQLQGASLAPASVFNQTGLTLSVPTSADRGDGRWCDHIKLFHLSRHFPHCGAGELSILYNFGAFKDGRSSFYDPTAATFNAHYGVYAVRLDDGRFGYADGKIDVAALLELVAFDQLALVMTSLGCPAGKQQFDSEVTSITPGPEMAGFNDWTQVDARILTTAPLSHFYGFKTGMLQYGCPSAAYDGEDFPVVPMVGRLYLRYDATRQITVIYFVMAKDAALIEETSATYLKPITWSD